MSAAPVVGPTTVVVSGPRAHRASTLRGPVVAAGSVAAATAVLALRDPHAASSYGVCPFHAVTGLWCPTCGGLRSTYDLIHLHLAAAWGENALWVVAAPLLVVGWIVVQVRRARGLPVGRVPVWAQVAGLAVVLAFGVLRNLPLFASLAP